MESPFCLLARPHFLSLPQWAGGLGWSDSSANDTSSGVIVQGLPALNLKG